MRILNLILFFLSLSVYNDLTGQDSLPQKPGYTKLYYPDGKLSSEGILINGRPDGYWKTYSENGNIRSEGNRRSGNLDSLWKFYDEDGILTTTIWYKDGKKSGDRIQYDNQGKITAKESYKQDKKNGISIQFQDEKEKFIISFTEGKEEGRGVEFDRSGNPVVLLDYKNGVLIRQQRVNRLDKQNRRTGSWVELFPGFSIKREVQYSEGLKNGYLKEYDNKGNLILLEKYIDDVLQKNVSGTRPPVSKKEYYPNYRIKRQGAFNDEGVPVGMHISFDTSGNIISAEEFQAGVVTARGPVDKNNLRQGRWVEFYATGEKKSEGNYEDDKKTGSWKYFHQNGQTEQTGIYVKGKPDGIWRWYYEGGSLLKEESYLSGNEDGFSFELSETGDTLSKGEYIDGEREGQWYFRQGNQLISGMFKAGEMDGQWKHIYPDGKTSFEGRFVAGVPEGRHQSFYEDGTPKWNGKYTAGKRDGTWRSYSPDGLLFLSVEYENGIEVRYDGVKIKPEFEPADFENLLDTNPYTF